MTNAALGSPEINLFPSQRRRFQAQRRMFQVVEFGMLIGLVVVALVAMAVWSLVMVSQRSINSAEQQISYLNQKISQLSAVEQQFQLLHNRLDQAAVILNEQQAPEQKIRQAVEMIPRGIDITTAKTNMAKKTVTIQLSTASFDIWRNAVAILESSSLPTIKLAGINRAADGSLGMTVELLMP